MATRRFEDAFTLAAKVRLFLLLPFGGSFLSRWRWDGDSSEIAFWLHASARDPWALLIGWGLFGALILLAVSAWRSGFRPSRQGTAMTAQEAYAAWGREGAVEAIALIPLAMFVVLVAVEARSLHRALVAQAATVVGCVAVHVVLLPLLLWGAHATKAPPTAANFVGRALGASAILRILCIAVGVLSYSVLWLEGDPNITVDTQVRDHWHRPILPRSGWAEFSEPGPGRDVRIILGTLAVLVGIAAWQLVRSRWIQAPRQSEAAAARAWVLTALACALPLYGWYNTAATACSIPRAGIGAKVNLVACAAFAVAISSLTPGFLFLAMRRQQKADLAAHLADRPR